MNSLGFQDQLGTSICRLEASVLSISGCFVCAVKIALNPGELKVSWMERGDTKSEWTNKSYKHLNQHGNMMLNFHRI